MEEGNYVDIRKVVRESLKKVKEDGGSIGQRIIKGAHGVFQWATLVVNIAVKLKIRRKNSQVILEMIEQLPGDLRQLYSSLLFRLDPDDTPGGPPTNFEAFPMVMSFGASIDSPRDSTRFRNRY